MQLKLKRNVFEIVRINRNLKRNLVVWFYRLSGDRVTGFGLVGTRFQVTMYIETSWKTKPSFQITMSNIFYAREVTPTYLIGLKVFQNTSRCSTLKAGKVNNIIVCVVKEGTRRLFEKI